jgi:hypothetical protein
MILAFDRDLDPVAPSGRRRDGVRALGRNALQLKMKRQELTGQVVEWDLSPISGREAERLHVVSFIFYSREPESAPPPDLSGGWIILLITRGLAPQP